MASPSPRDGMTDGMTDAILEAVQGSDDGSTGPPRHHALRALLVVLLLGAVAATAWIIIAKTAASRRRKPPSHSVPPWNPSPPSNQPWPQYAPWLPPGCKTEPTPAGKAWEWGASDISTSQPSYLEDTGCGGSFGAPSGTSGSGGASGGADGTPVLVCPPGPIVDSDALAGMPENQFYVHNPYDVPVRVMAMDSMGECGSGTKNYCYWRRDFTTDGQPFRHAKPAVLAPGTAQQLTSFVQKDCAFLGFVAATCTNHGPFWKELSEAYPPCQYGLSKGKGEPADHKPWWENLPGLGGLNPLCLSCMEPSHKSGVAGCNAYWDAGSTISPTTDPFFTPTAGGTGGLLQDADAHSSYPLAPPDPLAGPTAWTDQTEDGKPVYATVYPACTGSQSK